MNRIRKIDLDDAPKKAVKVNGPTRGGGRGRVGAVVKNKQTAFAAITKAEKGNKCGKQANSRVGPETGICVFQQTKLKSYAGRLYRDNLVRTVKVLEANVYRMNETSADFHDDD